MAVNVNPVSNYYSNYVPDYAAQRYNPKANNAAATTAAANAYEQILALQAEDVILTSSGAGFANDNNAAIDDASLGDADLLNLTPAALNILNGINNAQATNAEETLTITGTTSGNGLAATLTAEQQTQVATIVAQYANEPLTQSTLTQIQSALTAAGINPDEVSIQDLFNAYAYAYAPGLAFNGQVFTDTLASELLDT